MTKISNERYKSESFKFMWIILVNLLNNFF